MKNFKTYKQIDTDKQYSLAKESSKGFVKGAAKGAGVAGVINTAFPALIPTFAGMATGASNLGLIEKIGIGLGLASKPVVEISGLTILGIGALVGALAGGTISLIKTARYNRIVAKEAKRL
jgi:hypothetical protein